MSINDFIYQDQFEYPKQQDKNKDNKMEAVHKKETKPIKDNSKMVIDLKYIIKKQPRSFIVRAFMRKNLETIKSEEQELFEEEESN